jgi:predicted alpha/beta-hydrolase family hydrolase
MTAVDEQQLTLAVSPRLGEVSAVVRRPPDARFFLVLGHGAGAGMRYHFLEALTAALSNAGVATLRYQFPYMERGHRRPDAAPALQATVRSAVNAAGLLANGLPLFAGGKSMGGRMASQAQAERALHGVLGLVFFGFPLHPAGDPGSERADHLARVHLPMLFHQGTRDRLANLDLLEPILAPLGTRATLAIVDQADHDFALPKRLGIGPEEVCNQLAERTARWMALVGR